MQKVRKKMLSGNIISAHQVLAAERDYARSLIYEYNNTNQMKKKKTRRNRLIKAKGR